MSRVVVTGGGGFIGSHIVDQLCEQGHQVLVVDDFSTGDPANLAGARELYPDLDVFTGDIADAGTAERVRHFRPSAMLALAAQFSVKVSISDPLLDARTNVLGLVAMLEAARLGGCRKVVFASSGGTIYGSPDPSALPLPETSPRQPSSFYGLTKSVAIDYLRLYHELYGMDYAALALGNVYGPRQTPFGEAGVIAIFAQRMLTSQPCLVNGDGLNTRDYVYVTDVASAFVRAIGRGHGLINVGAGQEHSVLDIYALLSERIPAAAGCEHGPALPGEVRRICLDITRAGTELEWRPLIGLRDGIGEVVSWLSGRL